MSDDKLPIGSNSVLPKAVTPKISKPHKPERERLVEFFFRKNDPKMGYRCTCGVWAVGHGKHSKYCLRYRKD